MAGEPTSIARAIWVGTLWVNGTAAAGFAAPLAAVALLGELGVLAGLPGQADLAIVIGLFAASFGLAWTGWSFQITRWRLWAYRRVEDVGALKAAAVDAKLIWPDGHIFERTEPRSRDQAEELARLEARSSQRVETGVAAVEPARAPTRLGVVVKALFFGLALMPLCMLAPAGALQWLGINLTSNWIYRGAAAVFPFALAVLITHRAFKDGVSADEAFRRILPRGIRREEEIE